MDLESSIKNEAINTLNTSDKLNPKKRIGKSFSERALKQSDRGISIRNIDITSTLYRNNSEYNSERNSDSRRLSGDQNRDSNPNRVSDFNGDSFKKRQKKIELIEKEKKIRKEIIEENNGWNSELETIVANIGEKCAGFKWMHNKAINNYNFWYHFLGIINIIFASASSVLTQINTCSIDPVTKEAATGWEIILATVLMGLTAIMCGVNQFTNFGEISNKHQQAKSNYASLEHDIRIALGVYRKDRQIGKDFAEWISKEFDNIEASSPSIPDRIQKQYQNLIGGKGMSHNNIIDKIVVKNQDSNSQSQSNSQSPDDSPDIEMGGDIPRINVISDDQKKSHVEINVSEYDSPFENTRYKYEIQRFLQQ